MRHILTQRFGGLALLGILLLAACESAEERAQSHYERATALVEDGDSERAALEFRNALQANPEHVPSLRAYAAMLRSNGDSAGATREYIRLSRLQPDDASVHVVLAELALGMQDFPAVESYVERAYDLAPEDIDARAMKATIEFRQGDSEHALELAEGVLAEAPANVAAQMVLIAGRIADADYRAALALAERAIELVPDHPDLHLAKLAVLEKLGPPDAVRTQLETMNELFPANGMILQALMQWYIGHDQSDAAIGIMREIADRTPDDPAARLGVVQTLFETKGADAARSELEALVASEPDPWPFQIALARLDFAEGRRDEAISALEALVGGEESAPAVRNLQVALAEMLESVGRREEAREIAESVLAADARHVGGLKLRARWLIDEDRTEAALADLRAAAMEAPRDPEVMTLTAAAHEREGATELVGERLARAVEASNLGIEESTRYARFLIRERRFPQAEGLVLDALRRDPENQQLLMALGQIHLGRGDPARARQVAKLLRDLDAPAAVQAGTALELAALNAEGRVEETVKLLESITSKDSGNMRARAGLVRARLAAGDAEGARSEIDAILADDESGILGRLLLANLHVLENRPKEAEPVYRTVIDENPRLVEPYRQLFNLLGDLDRREEALAVLQGGIDATDRDSALLDLRAGQHYLDGEHEEAIKLYEEIYARDTSNVVMANNLASLLSMRRDDPESIDRAFAVARRLRGTEVPHFQDTYGWILVLRGDHEQALAYLEPAAQAIAGDPVVHYHLGMAYRGLERWEDARAAFARAVEAGGGKADVPELANARERLREIESLAEKTSVDG